jgi:hypothetical protein
MGNGYYKEWKDVEWIDLARVMSEFQALEIKGINLRIQ